MEYYTLVDNATSLTDEIVNDLNVIIDKALVIDLTIPDYMEARENPKKMYISYGNLTNFYNDLNSAILKANHLLLSLKDIIDKIASTKNIQYTANKEVISKFKALASRVKEKIDMVKEFKTSLEYTLKFYNSMSYMFNYSY